jgi:hypothetical protein
VIGGVERTISKKRDEIINKSYWDWNVSLPRVIAGMLISKSESTGKGREASDGVKGPCGKAAFLVVYFSILVDCTWNLDDHKNPSGFFHRGTCVVLKFHDVIFKNVLLDL